uniref:Uncharacterized protein n=1 Tax=viral metagenome TaxID=1070528 RepID=A0A6H1ZV25_9ZZZZ
MTNNVEETIIAIIKPHKDFSNTINQYEIAERYTMRRNEGIAPRRVRRVIENLIEKGYPIISTPREPGGYCYGGAENEALQCYKRLRRKALKEMLRARWTLRNSRRGQLSLLGEVG